MFLRMHSGVHERPLDDRSRRPLMAFSFETSTRVWENEGAGPPLVSREGARPPLTFFDDAFRESQSVSMLCPINLCLMMNRWSSSRNQIDELDGMAILTSPPPRRHSAHAYRDR